MVMMLVPIDEEQAKKDDNLCTTEESVGSYRPKVLVKKKKTKPENPNAIDPAKLLAGLIDLL